MTKVKLFTFSFACRNCSSEVRLLTTGDRQKEWLTVAMDSLNSEVSLPTQKEWASMELKDLCTIPGVEMIVTIPSPEKCKRCSNILFVSRKEHDS